MEQQPDLTESTSGPGVSIGARTVIGALCVLVFAALLWVDWLGPQRWLPSAAQALPGVQQLLEEGLILALVGAVLVGMALREYARMAHALGAQLPGLLLVAGGTVLVLLQWACWAAAARGGAFAVCPAWLARPGMTVTVGLCAAVLGLLAWRAVRGQVEGTMPAASMFALGLLYVPVTIGFIGGVRVRWGVAGVIVLLAACKATDIGAYYSGSLIGGPKLARRVSPRKTWAGAIGGTLAAALVALGLSLAGCGPLNVTQALLYGLLLGPVAVLGDLAESALKREAGVKDSGHLLPGAGGVLDMVDDVLFAAPFTYLFFAVAYGA